MRNCIVCLNGGRIINMDKVIEKFRDGIFSLNTNFGELAQHMIKILYKCTAADKKYYDLLDKNKKKIEVKFSRALRKIEAITEDNVIEVCTSASSKERPLLASEATEVIFDCNIQQLKPAEFDYLIYGIFFKDKIVIFKAASNEVPKMPGYSLQHKYGSEYQFHITKTRYNKHYPKFFDKELSYEELYKLFKK